MTKASARLEDPVHFPKWGTDEWHDFLVLTGPNASKDDVTQPFERVIRLREVLAEEVPDTTTTFRLSQYFSREGARQLSDELLALAGTWRLPPALVGEHSDRRVANPNNPHAYLYSDAVAVCACGHPVRRLRGDKAAARLPGREGHADDCTIEMREHAREELAANRCRLYRQLAHLNVPVAALTRRLGHDPRHKNLVELVEWAGIEDPPAVRREGRRRMLRTILVLLRTESPETVARVYGTTIRSLRRMVNRETTSDATALWSVRRRAQSENFAYPLGFAWKPMQNNRTESGLPRSFAGRQTVRTDGGSE